MAIVCHSPSVGLTPHPGPGGQGEIAGAQASSACGLEHSSTQGGLAWAGVVAGCRLPLCSPGMPRMEGGLAAGLSAHLCCSGVSLLLLCLLNTA